MTFMAAYNKLPNTLFPPDTDFTVIPQYQTNKRVGRLPSSSSRSKSFSKTKPVFILQLKSPRDLCYRSSRDIADRQIRGRIWDITADCPPLVLPDLHAVSAMGTKLCFYRGLTEPPFLGAHQPTFEMDTAASERWDCDILEEEGMERFQAVVREIKEGCEALSMMP